MLIFHTIFFIFCFQSIESKAKCRKPLGYIGEVRISGCMTSKCVKTGKNKAKWIPQNNTGIGIMISGGDGSTVSVEHHHLSDGVQVVQGLPDLPDSRSGHTSDGNILCGGENSNDPSTCLSLDDDKRGWTISHNLTQPRTWHSSWVVSEGIILMGGTSTDSRLTSELIRFDGGVEESFDLSYYTYYACAIPDILSDTVVLTGGYQSTSSYNRVTRYGRNGFLEVLPNLSISHYQHACGYFINSNNELVMMIYI